MDWSEEKGDATKREEGGGTRMKNVKGGYIFWGEEGKKVVKGEGEENNN